MARDRDDALSWGGDDDPTLDVGAATAAQRASPAEPAALPDDFTPVDNGSDRVGRRHTDTTAPTPGERQRLGNAALITFGVLGGVYVIYILGWVTGGLRLQGAAQYLVTDVMFQASLWLAILAPALWFGTVLLLTRRSRPWVHFAWLVAGVVLLVPWPFVMVGAVGQ